jgi:alkylation response protein AidB-like acyl-CoA dehydrogenase
MHLVGTAPASWVLGEVSKHWDLELAMWVPTLALGVAAVAMAFATASFAADHARARAAAAAAG